MIQIFGAVEDDTSGYSVSSAGDFNNDGYSDIIIGATFAIPASRSYAGTSYVILGKATGLTDIDLSTDLASSGIGLKVLNYLQYYTSFLEK